MLLSLMTKLIIPAVNAFSHQKTAQKAGTQEYQSDQDSC